MIKTKKIRVFLPVLLSLIIVFLFPSLSKAFESERNIGGSLYEFKRNGNYNLSEAGSSSTIDESGTAFGKFSIVGDLEQLQEGDTSSFILYTGNVTLKYEVNQDYFKKANKSRYVCKENKKSINGEELGSKIGKGAIIVQASLDGTNWVTQKKFLDIGGDNPNFNGNLYQTSEMQTANGCYYRVLVVYKTRKKEGFKNDYRKYVEEYKFYVEKYEEPIIEETASISTGNRKELGTTEKKKKNKGYDITQTMGVNDPHYGWSLGCFVISGFTTEATEGNNENPVFLKITNEGQDDTVKLKFKLKKDINRLNGDDKLTIVEDKKGYDQYFQVAKQNFGRGTLIIRKTDVDGTVHAPIIYTDYLSGVVSSDANTEIEVNEEGDYEAALNYKIKKKNGLATATYDYRIFIKFSVRNGNCMFFPRDLSTDLKATLSDRAIAPNGFELDLAESKDLDLNIKKYDLNGNEDLLFNKPALDGNQYTEEGKYVITAKNKYTGEKVEKTIYVGDKSKIEVILGKNDEAKEKEEDIKEEENNEKKEPEEKEPEEKEPEEKELEKDNDLEPEGEQDIQEEILDSELEEKEENAEAKSEKKSEKELESDAKSTSDTKPAAEEEQ